MDIQSFNFPTLSSTDIVFGKPFELVYKEGLPKEFVDKVAPYIMALMKSFEPKHEDKEAICALLFSELVEPEMKPIEKA